MTGYVYILASKEYGTLYVGVTSNLIKRVYEHREKLGPGFTEKYHVDRLVYYEIFEDIESAKTREKQMKKWERDWKVNLINKLNPEWNDLYSNLI